MMAVGRFRAVRQHVVAGEDCYNPRHGQGRLPLRGEGAGERLGEVEGRAAAGYHDRAGPDLGQVLANGGVAAALSLANGLATLEGWFAMFIGVLAAVSVATACAWPGTVAEGVATLPGAEPGSLSIEHPSGEMTVTLDYTRTGDTLTLRKSGVVRTARLLSRGKVFAP